MKGNFVSYYRVSTQQQGRSGLGLEAQKKAVMDYLNGGNWELIEEYIEIESGKNNDRPKLNEALERCRLTGSTLVIAKLDRLSRDAHFLLGLQKSEVDFVCCDMPDANKMTIQIMAVMAQHEREAISKRTKEALAAAKARGVKLGNPNGADNFSDDSYKLGVKAIKSNADIRAEGLRVTMQGIMEAGTTSFSGIAKELNAQKIKTARGGKWHPSSVKRLLERLNSSAI